MTLTLTTIIWDAKGNEKHQKYEGVHVNLLPGDLLTIGARTYMVIKRAFIQWGGTDVAITLQQDIYTTTIR